jgi:hypothetical protein
MVCQSHIEARWFPYDQGFLFYQHGWLRVAPYACLIHLQEIFNGIHYDIIADGSLKWELGL